MTVAFNLNMDLVLYQLPEKITLHIGFHDTAGKVHGEGILKAYDGAVCAGGKGLAHIDVKAFDMGLHILRHLDCTHVGEPGGGIFVLNSGVKEPHHKINEIFCFYTLSANYSFSEDSVADSVIDS